MDSKMRRVEVTNNNATTLGVHPWMVKNKQY